MTIAFTNNASSTLAAGVLAGATTLTVQALDAGRFPAPAAGDWFPVTVVEGNNLEIMRCTARAGVTLTVVRGQEGTSAIPFNAGALVDHRLTRAALEAFLQSTGGTMTGQLTIAPAAANARLLLSAPAGAFNSMLVLNKDVGSTGGNVVQGQVAGANRWMMYLGTGAEGGANAGSDFYLQRYSDAGAFIDSPITIPRSTGKLALSQAPTIPAPGVGGDAANKTYVDAAVAAMITTADAPPATPKPGQLWWESDTGNTFIWYVDANTSQWVQVNITAPPSNVVANTLDVIFRADGTFTPDPKMLFCDAWDWGGGGAGGGHGITTTTNSVGGGGAAGAKAYGRFTKAQIGASQPVIIGPGGVGVAASIGGAGGETSLGTLLRAAGGLGGRTVIASLGGSPTRAAIDNPVQSPAGDIRGWTVPGDGGFCMRDSTAAGFQTWGGNGGMTEWGGAGIGVSLTTGGGGGGAAQPNTGSGGGGAAASNNQGAGRVGGNGGSGILLIKQYLSP